MRPERTGCPLLPPAQAEIRRAEQNGARGIKNEGGTLHGGTESAPAVPGV